jgi:hypothetical protein
VEREEVAAGRAGLGRKGGVLWRRRWWSSWWVTDSRAADWDWLSPVFCSLCTLIRVSCKSGVMLLTIEIVNYF